MKVSKAEECLKFEDVYHHEAQKSWKLRDFKFTDHESAGNLRLEFPSHAQICLNLWISRRVSRSPEVLLKAGAAN